MTAAGSLDALEELGGLASVRGSVSPHSPQNFAFASFGPPHVRQRTARGDPHSRQNFRPSAFGAPQFEQSDM
jgi:hypothetical protein